MRIDKEKDEHRERMNKTNGFIVHEDEELSSDEILNESVSNSFFRIEMHLNVKRAK